MNRIWNRFQSPAIRIGGWWLVSLVSTSVVLEMGDFGIPLWIAPFCLLWVLTLGFPTVLAYIGMAFVWGVCSPFDGLAFYLLCVAGLSLVLHSAAFFLLARMKKNWRPR